MRKHSLMDLMPEVLAALQGTGANVSLAEDLEAAIEADRQRRGEPVPKGWKLVPETPTSKQIVHMACQIKGADADGWFRTDGDDWPEYVDAAERAYKWALSEAPQPAEPVKVPSDADIEDLVKGIASEMFGEDDTPYEQCDREFYGHLARALLSRYGSGQPAASAELRCRKCGERANVSISSASLVAHWSDGTPRDERDIASDPEGKLIHDPSEPLRAAPVAAQAQAVVNQQMTTASDVLADTQRAIIEAAERRGYARAMAECAQDRQDAERYRWAQQFMRLDDVGDDQYSLGLVIDSERLEGCVSDEAARLDYERNQQRWANVKSPDDEPADIPAVTLNDAIDAARAAKGADHA